MNLSEQAELWRLEGGISRSDERFNAPLVPGFADEFADFLAADVELETTKALVHPSPPSLSRELPRYIC